MIRDETAVSPVLATVLMVGFTIILAATLWGLLSAFLTQDWSDPFPDQDQDDETDDGRHSETRTEKWSVEPLPGYDCSTPSIGPAEYLCVKVDVS